MSDLKVMKHQASKLKKEIDGVKHCGRTTYALVKDLYDLKGGRRKVYDTLIKMIRNLDQKQESDILTIPS